MPQNGNPDEIDAGQVVTDHGPATDPAAGVGLDDPHCSWDVRIETNHRQVTRQAAINRTGRPGSELEVEERPNELIWPAWPLTAADLSLAGSPLAELEKDWSVAGGRLRESAKWMATVLGAALAAVIGSSPLADLSSHHLSWVAVAMLLGGLLSLSLTMLLILRVMQPQAVSYDDIETAKPGSAHLRFAKKHPARRWPRLPFSASPLYQWKRNIERHKDLYLPCDITSLRALREAMALEQATLATLAAVDAQKGGEQPQAGELSLVQAARAARLIELRATAARITSIGECYELKARSTEAMYYGTILGLLGTAAVLVAFAWPIR